MSSILWRPEVNPLTKPQSYWPRHIPRAVAGNDKIAALMEQKNPLYNESMSKGFLLDLADVICEELINGNQSTLDNLFTCHISFTGRLDAPDAPMPPLDESLQVRLYPSKRLVDAVRQAAHTERLPQEKKLPLISLAFDSLLKLNDVLNPEGVLQVMGDDLFFDQESGTDECVLEGTRNGRTVQSRFVSISNNTIQLMPDIPTQTQPYNNEYRLLVSTHYTEHGTMRTGTYARMLRTPLGVRIGDSPGILSGAGNTPFVTVSGGTLTAEGARVRIQVLHDVQDGDLRFNLLDMKEGGKAGNEVQVSANGVYLLPGYTGGDVTSIEVTVARYANLLAMVRNPYGGRLVDILNVSMGS